MREVVKKALLIMGLVLLAVINGLVSWMVVTIMTVRV
jgi:TRAP-type C4-dicarboxylate transport system permease small subunit